MARSRRQRGLDPAVLETFPTLAFAEVKELRIGKGSLECAVCLSEFEDDETLRLLPTCSHAFHPDCIDAWLASHVTCPVCRCNLVPDPAAAAPSPPSAANLDPAPAPAPAPDSTGAEDAAEPTPLAREGEGEVVIDVADEEREEERRKQEAIELQRIGSQRQAMRARSGRRPARFPRSHSTGHSLTTTTTTTTTAPAPAMVAAPEAEGNPDRYTLRLPEHVRREIVAAGRLKRTRSLLAFPSGGEESSRRGYRGGGGGGEGSSRGGRSVRLGRSERWPNFFTRTFSARVPAWASGRRSVEGSVKKGEGDGSTRGKLAAAVAPFDCFVGGGAAASSSKGGAGEEDDESSTAALARRV
ncbi:E3 ubiquitin-protein ligase ATL31 [Ananas comosus]|uniref:RING-type E3 ubiquitin transferase n=1 Tax=Ananas comosus TaxID=4615 RepID=A0A199W7W6_ANACO|nr:E3 ubiquitin-protein ligase ATL31 [Ananas comosus]